MVQSNIKVHYLQYSYLCSYSIYCMCNESTCFPMIPFNLSLHLHIWRVVCWVLAYDWAKAFSSCYVVSMCIWICWYRFRCTDKYGCTVRRLTARSRKVSKSRDSGLDSSNRSEIWKAPRQQRCRGACQLTERCDNCNTQSRGFETSRDLAVRRLTA